MVSMGFLYFLNLFCKAIFRAFSDLFSELFSEHPLSIFCKEFSVKSSNKPHRGLFQTARSCSVLAREHERAFDQAAGMSKSAHLLMQAEDCL